MVSNSILPIIEFHEIIIDYQYYMNENCKKVIVFDRMHLTLLGILFVIYVHERAELSLWLA